jgi:uncharacterized membrane protein
MLASVLEALPMIAIGGVALVHAVFAYKEIFDWEGSAVKVIGMTPEDARASATVGKNQGLSNGFLAAGATWSLAEWWLHGPSAGRPPATFFAACALLAGLFGFATFRKRGFLIKQALPGAVTLLTVWLQKILSTASAGP